MKKGIIGKKLGMTQIFDEKGNVIPVTLIEAGPCVVAQKKTVECDGYNALQLAYEDIKAKNVNKAQLGHFAKTDGCAVACAIALGYVTLRNRQDALCGDYAVILNYYRTVV